MQFTATFVLAALPFLSLASPTTRSSKGISIPISKRSSNTSGVVDAAKLRSHLANVHAKYDKTLANFESNTGKVHPNAINRNKIQRRDTGADSLTDSQEELWYGSISVGTPAVTYTVDFDTGSSDLFVPDSTCSTCGSHTKYKASSSSTSKELGKTFSLEYGDGSTTSGNLYTDTVTVAGLTATSQTLGSATKYSSSFTDGPSDGLMGLAFPSLSSYPATPFFNTLVDNGLVDAGAFGFYLSSEGSELYLGGADGNLYSGDFNYCPVTQEGYWQIDMDSANVNGQGAVTGLSVIVDSGTTLIVGDDSTVKTFYDSVSGSEDASSTVGTGFYSFPCSSVPNVSFTFNGVEYSVSAGNFNLGQVTEGSSSCVGAVVGGGENFWIMGDAFMKNVYTTFDFDNSQVGFASLA